MKTSNAQDWVTCLHCNGNGWFDSVFPAVLCRACDGQGLVSPSTGEPYQFPSPADVPAPVGGR